MQESDLWCDLRRHYNSFICTCWTKLWHACKSGSFFTFTARSSVTFRKARIEGLTALWNIHVKHHRHRTYVRPLAQCRAVSSWPEHSLVSPTETDGEHLLWQASLLGAVYAQVQERTTSFSERSWHPKGPEPILPNCLLLLSSFSSKLHVNESDVCNF